VSEPADTEAWRQRRLDALLDPDGWLTVAGLFFPEPGVSRVGTDPACEIPLPEGSAPALTAYVLAERERIWLELAEGVQGTINDQPMRGRVELRLPDRALGRAVDVVRVGRIALLAHRSGERMGVRVRDRESPMLTRFAGLDWHPVRPEWRTRGRFFPYAGTRVTPLENVLGDLVDEPIVGEVEFGVAAETMRLVAIDRGRRLFFVFRDASSGRGTYYMRFLYADKPDAEGVVTLDFNRAYNPPCAFTPYASCTLPPEENRLPVAIEAGEKLYRGPAPD
jgi:uncharacterized protein (DUF1684 family)